MAELNLALTEKFGAENAAAIRAELSEYLKVNEPRFIIMRSADPLLPGFPISLWYRTARTGRRTLISGLRRKEPHYGG